tara:strand:+ start:3245 stop:3613 length:369 start_codon:yes stop_codon:yes gene_type:complete
VERSGLLIVKTYIQLLKRRLLTMVVKFVEVFESTRVHSNDTNRTFSLREVFVNPEQVVCVRSDVDVNQRLQEGYLPEGLDPRQEFSRIYLNRGQAGLDIVVVGKPSIIEKELKKNYKQVLKG